MNKMLETTDFDELTAAQEDWDIQHRPTQANRFKGKLVLGRVDNIQVDLEQWNTGLELIGASPQQGLSFALPLEDSNTYFSQGVEVGTDQIDVFGPGCDVFALTKPHTTLVSCSLPIDAVYKRVDSPLAMSIAEQAIGHKVICTTRQAADGLRRRLLTLLDMSAVDTIPAEAHDGLLDELLLVIVQALSAGAGDRDARYQGRYRLARRARDFMLERQANPPSVAELCSFVNTSERTLHYAFSQVYGVSPKRFLKSRRLFAARQGLKSADAGSRVSDIAMRLGFWDLGYFARDYQSMFGELPSATLNG